MTAVQPPGRFGALDLDGDRSHRLPGEAAGRRRLDQRRLLRAFAAASSTTSRATRPSGSASRSSASRASGQLRAYRHHGFWQPMDTLRDKTHLEELWACGQGALEDLVMPARRSGTASASSSPATPASRAAGSALWLDALGAEVTGYALEPPTDAEPLSRLRGLGSEIVSASRRHARSRGPRARRSRDARPEVVFHLAAQSLVRPSYDDPVETLRDQRHGHGPRARGGAPRAPACAPWSSSPATSATRTARWVRALPRERAAGRPRSLQQQQGLRRARDRRLPAIVLRHRRHARVASARARAT